MTKPETDKAKAKLDDKDKPKLMKEIVGDIEPKERLLDSRAKPKTKPLLG